MWHVLFTHFICCIFQAANLGSQDDGWQLKRKKNINNLEGKLLGYNKNDLEKYSKAKSVQKEVQRVECKCWFSIIQMESMQVGYWLQIKLLLLITMNFSNLHLLRNPSCASCQSWPKKSFYPEPGSIFHLNRAWKKGFSTTQLLYKLGCWFSVSSSVTTFSF